MSDITDTIAGYVDRIDTRACADLMGVSYSSLMRKINPHDAYQLNAREIIPLIQASGDASLLHHLCHRLGYTAQPIRKSLPRKPTTTTIAMFIRESGRAAQILSEVILKDECKITQKDARRCVGCLHLVIRHAHGLAKHLQALLERKESKP
jgi:hypothetical protein